MIEAGQRPVRAFEWLFRSRKTGRFTVVQWPNYALWLVIGCTLARWLMHPEGALDQTLHWAGVAGLVWWSLDEIIRGVSPFRRVLGVVVLARLVIRIVDPGSVLG